MAKALGTLTLLSNEIPALLRKNSSVGLLHSAGTLGDPAARSDERWALTPPFHPYSKALSSTMSRIPCRPSRKLSFAAVYFLWHFP